MIFVVVFYYQNIYTTTLFTFI